MFVIVPPPLSPNCPDCLSAGFRHEPECRRGQAATAHLARREHGGGGWRGELLAAAAWWAGKTGDPHGPLPRHYRGAAGLTDADLEEAGAADLTDVAAVHFLAWAGCVQVYPAGDLYRPRPRAGK